MFEKIKRVFKTFIIANRCASGKHDYSYMRTVAVTPAGERLDCDLWVCKHCFNERYEPDQDMLKKEGLVYTENTLFRQQRLANLMNDQQMWLEFCKHIGKVGIRPKQLNKDYVNILETIGEVDSEYLKLVVERLERGY